jgi:hypothetical protein
MGKLNPERESTTRKTKTENLLFMAGLYREVKDEDDPTVCTREFVIITRSHRRYEQNQDRMPVILRVEQIERWLTGEMTPEEYEKLAFDVSVFPCDDGDAPRQDHLVLGIWYAECMSVNNKTENTKR